MDPVSAAAIFIGAGCGALLRWALGLALNPLLPNYPLGTLAANVLGGLLVGAMLGLFAPFSHLPPSMRLALTTGFLGGLTTFSAFTAETLSLLMRSDYAGGLVLIVAHVALSLLAAVGGLLGARWLYTALGGPLP